MSRKASDALGSQRESLSTNPLLISSELGKPRNRCFSMPPADFTFGVKTSRLDGGTAEALSTWHQVHSKSLTKKEPEKDFIALNRLAAQSGLTSSHEQTQFRACNDIRRRDDDKKEKKNVRPFPDDMIFGIATRPSTPLSELLENRYQERWLNDMRESERKQRREIFKRQLHGKVYETRASLLRRFPEPVEPPPYWRMSRFSNIPATLCTFRSKRQHERAHTYHQSDLAGRQGMIGQGIHQTA